MIKVDELQALGEAVELLKTKLMVDQEVLEQSEIDSMQRTIRDLNWMISQRRHENYKKQLEGFRRHLDTTFNEYYTDDDDKLKLFYNMNFEVTFNGKKIVLENGADVFNGICTLIDDEIEEQQ